MYGGTESVDIQIWTPPVQAYASFVGMWLTMIFRISGIRIIRAGTHQQGARAMRPPSRVVATRALVPALLLFAAGESLGWWSAAAARRAKTVTTTGLPTKPDPARDCSWGPAVWCSGLPSVVCEETKTCADLPETVKPTPNAGLQAWAKVALRMRRAAKEARNKPLDVLFLGDSITEALRGTAGGVPDSHYSNRGTKRLFKEVFGETVLALGISADRTQHLLQRLVTGELAGLQPKIVVLLIGCNNLATNTNNEIAQGVTAAVSYLRGAFKQLSTHIVVMAVLPQARCLRDEAGSVTICRPDIGNRIRGTNSALETNLHGISEATFLDCASSVLEEGAPDPPSYLLRDGLHPTHLGYRHIWAMCLIPELKKHGFVPRSGIEDS
ncbi:Platelet-activating factor acetylhydrolase IB subunit beta-like protein [Diplonema papillatum]|nr:Platelet-activating factor acetylhydrolase IB subunit beta-like protein [Diplonema papillatum]